MLWLKKKKQKSFRRSKWRFRFGAFSSAPKRSRHPAYLKQGRKAKNKGGRRMVTLKRRRLWNTNFTRSLTSFRWWRTTIPKGSRASSRTFAREPIDIYEGKILDGRNRYRAVLQAIKEPKENDSSEIQILRCEISRHVLDDQQKWNRKQKEWGRSDPWVFEDHYGGSPLEYVISKNLHRRHLTDDQRAMVAAGMLPMLKEEARQRKGTRTDLGVNSPSGSGRSDQKAADLAKVTQHQVRQAKTVTKASPELAAEVASGKKKLHAAAKEVAKPFVPKSAAPRPSDALPKRGKKANADAIMSMIKVQN
jgi:hypothetical protein